MERLASPEGQKKISDLFLTRTEWLIAMIEALTKYQRVSQKELCPSTIFLQNLLTTVQESDSIQGRTPIIGDLTISICHLWSELRQLTSVTIHTIYETIWKVSEIHEHAPTTTLRIKHISYNIPSVQDEPTAVFGITISPTHSACLLEDDNPETARFSTHGSFERNDSEVKSAEDQLENNFKSMRMQQLASKRGRYTPESKEIPILKPVGQSTTPTQPKRPPVNSTDLTQPKGKYHFHGKNSDLVALLSRFHFLLPENSVSVKHLNVAVDELSCLYAGTIIEPFIQALKASNDVQLNEFHLTSLVLENGRGFESALQDVLTNEKNIELRELLQYFNVSLSCLTIIG